MATEIMTWTTKTEKGTTVKMTWTARDGESIYTAETPDGWMATAHSVTRAKDEIDSWMAQG